MRVSIKSLVVKIIKFGVAAGLIYWMIHKGLLDLSMMGQLITPMHISVLLILIFVNIFINNFRWSILLSSQELPSGARLTLPLTLIGLFFNFAVPGAVGGDLVKAYYVAKDHPGRRMTAATSVIMDRIIGLYAMVLMAVVTMLLNLSVIHAKAPLIKIFYSSIAVLVLMTVALGLMFSSRVKSKNPIVIWAPKIPGGAMLLKLYEAVHSYGKCRKEVATAVLVSLIGQSLAVLVMAYVGFALGESLTMATYFFAVPLGFIVMALPLSPAGIGVGQVAFLVLFQMFTGGQTIVGQSVITAYQIGLLCWGLVGAIIYAQRKKPSALSEVTT